MRLVWIIMVGCLLSSSARSQDAQQLHQNGVRFLQQNDYGNAIIVLKKAAEMDPTNTEIVNDLGFAYFLAGQYKTGYDLMKPMAESKNADDRTYQITCMLLRGGRNIKEAELVYRIGLQTFPKSGALYADYGEFLELVQPGAGAGIVYWEKGIQFDPSYPGNYYHAARYYAEQNNHFWAVIYGEIFVNMESYTTRTVETKNLMYDSYKRLFAFGLETVKTASAFQQEASKLLMKQEPLATNGINPEILTAMRTRFLLDWYNSPLAARFPFVLFDHQRLLLQEGVFDAYNQWLFGSVANLNAFQNWTKTHPEEYVSFNELQRNRLFKMTNGQYYH